MGRESLRNVPSDDIEGAAPQDAMLPGELSLQLRAASSRKETSSCRAGRSGRPMGAHDLQQNLRRRHPRQNKTPECPTLPRHRLRVDSIRPNPFRLKKSCCSANPLVETITALRRSFRPCPVSSMQASRVAVFHLTETGSGVGQKRVLAGFQRQAVSIQ
jgi:hypothetical protein